jgi:Flp pilus assembly protein TadD
MPEARNNLGAALWRKGELLRAERELNEAVRLRPDYAEAYFNLGHTAVRDRRIGDAAAHFRKAATLKDDWLVALTTASWVLATAGDRAVRAPAEAVTFAERAARLTARRDARTLDVLAVAYASAGRFDDAVLAAREAQALADPALAQQIAVRLAMFERREAYVDKP